MPYREKSSPLWLVLGMVAVLILLAGAFGYFWYLERQMSAGPGDGALSSPSPVVKDKPQEPEAVSQPIPEPAQEPRRKEAVSPRPVRTKAPAQDNRAGVISGRVINEEGRPLPGTTVDCESAKAGQTLSDATGRFSLSFPQREGKADLRLTRGNQGAVTLEAVAIGTTDLEVVMSRGVTLQGVVLAQATGKPVTQFSVRIAQVEVERDEDAGYQAVLEREVKSKEGRFELEGVVPGTMQVAVWARGYARVEQEATLSSEGGGEPMTFHLPQEQVLRGQVRDAATGNPVPNARVYLNDLPTVEYNSTHAAETGADGRFEIQHLPAGSIRLGVATKEHYAARLVDTDPVHSPVNVDLVYAGMLHGYVTYKGQPVPDAAVTVYAPDDVGGLSMVRMRRTDKAGYYTFSTLPAGELRAHAANPLNVSDAFRGAMVEIAQGYETRQDFEF